MSVLISGMEMPKSGYVDVRIFHDNKATTATGERPFYKEMDVVELPPHGRLIDADGFMRDECNSCDGACESVPCDCVNCHADCRCIFMRDILDAPTVIPAEGET